MAFEGYKLMFIRLSICIAVYLTFAYIIIGIITEMQKNYYRGMIKENNFPCKMADFNS